jgi:predicted unusual protein kinase regulating ubiquinone biosynthesis (AarF/ABC1/UbiB family)
MARSPVTTSQRISRARKTSMTFARVYLGIRAQRFIARRLRPADMKTRWARFNRASAQNIYDAAVDLRGLILKGCQFLGTRADVLPREYVDTLSKLQDRVPPKSFGVVRRVVENELGCEISDLFEFFSPKPLASASLAQVHEATLRDGRPVAVKVQYPEIEALIRGDLANLRFLFGAVSWLERDFDPSPLIDELATYVPRELNFVNEGRNAEQIARFFANRDDIAVPRIHWEFTTRRVLVMEYVDGIKISDVDALRAAGIDPDQVARILIEAYCVQILVHGFFHADPHPGNLLVQRLPDGSPRLVMLDFGLAKDLPPRFRDRVVSLASALLRGDASLLAESLVELGFETRDGTQESLLPIARFILDAMQHFRTRSHADAEFTDRIGRELPELVRANPIVRIPSHLVLMGRVFGLLSGLSRTLGSRVDLVQTILPYVSGMQRS